MTIRLTMKNWRSIEDATITIEPLTVIVGRNSSGKSNVVDAIRFVCDVAWDASNAVARRGGFDSIRRWSATEDSDVTLCARVSASQDALETDYVEHAMVLAGGEFGEWQFVEETIEAVRPLAKFRFVRRGERIAVESSTPVRNWPFESLEVDPNTSAALYTRQVRIDGDKRRRAIPFPHEVSAIWPIPKEMKRPQPHLESGVVEDDAQNIASVIMQMDPDEMHDVVEVMKLIVPGLIGVYAKSLGRYVSLAFEQSYRDGTVATFEATEMSDGTLRALALVVAANQVVEGDVLIVEEPEVNLHPGAAAVVYATLLEASLRGTVVITTHSPEMLELARDAHVLVCEYDDGVTRVGPLASSQRDVIRNGLFSVAELVRSEDLRREGADPKVVPG